MNEEIWLGLRALFHEANKSGNNFSRKVKSMQSIYFRENRPIYSEAEQKEIEYFLSAFLFKFDLFNLSLEQLWALSYSKRAGLVQALENSLDCLNIEDEELLLASYSLEGFLFQGKACLDFYFLYLCRLLQTDHRGSISKNKFFKALDGLKSENMALKGKKIKEYFEQNVFSENPGMTGLFPKNWGTLLSDLRDKIAHRDMVRPSFKSKEMLLGKVLFNWPTLKDMTFDRFCQSIQNGFFFLVTDLSNLLYAVQWRPGPI